MPRSGTADRGWACILSMGDRVKELSGGEGQTNNRMELTALLEGLRGLKRSCAVDVVSEWIRPHTPAAFADASV